MPLTQPLLVKMDPRNKTPAAALQQQFAVSQRLAEAMRADVDALESLRKLRKEHPEMEAKLAPLEGSLEEKRPWAKEQPPALAPWSARLEAAYILLQSSDAPPTPQALRAADKLINESADLVARFKKLSASP